MKIEKPYDATRVVALRRMVIDLETLDYIIYFINFRKLKNVVNTVFKVWIKMQVVVKYLALFFICGTIFVYIISVFKYIYKTEKI